MSALARTGWGISAALFATLLASILHVDYAGLAPVILLLVVTAVAAVRPETGVLLVVSIVPVAWYGLSPLWNDRIPWAEALACAALVGLSLEAAIARGRRMERPMPPAVRTPAILFGVLVAGSMIASLGVKALPLGPGFTDALVTQITREYFVDLRGFPPLHAGLLLLEGLLLFAAAHRVTASRIVMRRVVAAAVTGGALAAVLNIWRLLLASARGGPFWSRLGELASTVRWNVHYADFNAAGSYFAMTTVLAIAVAAGSRRRGTAAGCATILGIALWLTSSRAAYLAAVIALAAAVVLLRMATPGRRRIVTAAVAGASAIVLIVIVATLAPHRGNQKSSLTAADVRIELARASGRMIATHPVFGIGLGEFYQRSGEFSSPELLATFPAAVHENAHNNFLQVTAELGLPGGVLFVWLVAAALIALARPAIVSQDAFALFTVAALGAFVVTWLAGHPLLVPEPAYVFWTLLGVAASGGAANPRIERPSRPWAWLLAAGCIAIVLTIPWRTRTMMAEADLEHIGIGVSTNWQLSPDGIRYRDAEGRASIFVPRRTGFKFSVNPRIDRSVRLEIRLDGRVANVVSLAPHRWNDLSFPARTERLAAGYSRLDLRVVDDDRTAIWITKVQPIESR
jgi:O-antigen ligase